VLVALLAYSSTLKMETTSSLETLVTSSGVISQKTLFFIFHRFNNLESNIFTISTNITFLDIIDLFVSKTLPSLYFKTKHFGDWIQSLSSGKTYSVWPN
jgi:hypothetical protein